MANLALDFPPLEGLYLTHFDDIKGQSTIFYTSSNESRLSSDGIEHKSLPSGLHTLESDLILGTHHGYPTVGLFRSKTHESGRGRLMGTLGVILERGYPVEHLFGLRKSLAKLFDHLESLSTPKEVFSSQSDSATSKCLQELWQKYSTSSHSQAGKSGPSSAGPSKEVRRLVDGQSRCSDEHPVAYFSLLLELLGPNIVTVYKAAIAGKRILIHSAPPLLPLSAFSWCIWAMSLPPSSASEASISEWIGHVGLMDLAAIKGKKGGWIATTSDAIYKSHTDAYDLFIDFPPLSSALANAPSTTSQTLPDASPDRQPAEPVSPPILLSSEPPPSSSTTSQKPIKEPQIVAYHFADLPLYRSLLMLSSSPGSITVTSTLSKSGGIWLLAFELFEKVWNLCVGVCEYAIGRGGQTGRVRLDNEESERLLDDPLYGEYDESPPEISQFNDLDDASAGTAGPSRSPRMSVDVDSIDDGDETEEADDGESEEIRKGRLILRQLHHNTYHLYARLREVRRGTGGALTQDELKELCGGGWSRWRSDPALTAEGRQWLDLAKQWGIAMDVDE